MARQGRVLVPARWQPLRDSGFCARLLMPNGRGVAIFHIPPSLAASLRSSRDPSRGERGNQVLMAQPLLRCFPEILTRGEKPKLQDSLCKRECGV